MEGIVLVHNYLILHQGLGIVEVCGSIRVLLLIYM